MIIIIITNYVKLLISYFPLKTHLKGYNLLRMCYSSYFLNGSIILKMINDIILYYLGRG